MGKRVINIDESGSTFFTERVLVDGSITYGDTTYLVFVIPILSVALIFGILPPIVLTLYPTRAFRFCLSKCNLKFIALDIFVDKVHGCYRNGLNGGKDMRSFSGLLFVLRICLLYTSPSPRDKRQSRMPSSA